MSNDQILMLKIMILLIPYLLNQKQVEYEVILK
jgi:hypothetical protein